VAARHRFHRLLQVGVDVRVVEDRLRVHADVVVDDELQPRQADAGVGHLAKSKASCGLPTFIMILIGQYGISPRTHLGDLGLQQAVVDVAGVAFGAGHGDQRALVQRSVASPQPTTAGMPSSRAMMAAWQVRPPRLVTMALARFITGSQLGSVMSVTSTSPGCTRSISAVLRTRRTGPVPIFWPMARPSASTGVLPVPLSL
jgi:hypothetical protein